MTPDDKFWSETLDALGRRFYQAALKYGRYGIEIGAANEDYCWRWQQFPASRRPKVDDIAVALNPASDIGRWPHVFSFRKWALV